MTQVMHKLEQLARAVTARAPAPVRGLVHRLEAAYHAWHDDPFADTSPSPAMDAATGAGPEPVATEPSTVVTPRAEINWELRSQAELADHLEQHYHAGLRRDLPVLIEAAQQIEREHARHTAVPRGLSDVLAELFAALDSHMMKEERILFPALRTGARGGAIDMPMRMMEREHEDHAEGLDTIRTLTGGLQAPNDASPAWSALYLALATLEADLRQHVYLENHVLFARASGGADE